MTETPPASVLHLGEVETDLVPGPVEYAVLTPPDTGSSPRALVLLLHGGNGSRDLSSQMRPAIEQAWADGRLEPAVVVTPSSRRSFYMNCRDGSERWEDVVLGPIVDVARRASSRPCRSARSPSKTGSGVTMRSSGRSTGHPSTRTTGRRTTRRTSCWPPPLVCVPRGCPSPSSAATSTASASIGAPSSSPGSCSTRACTHEYHLVRGAGHLGRSLGRRFAHTLDFLGAALHPPAPDAALVPLHTMIANLRQRAGLDP